MTSFAGAVFASVPRKEQRAEGDCYLRGLMLGESAEVIARRVGLPAA
ncbi:hypothetical protein ACFV0T_29300 [Streptomyces sp. NPDC059582]